MLHISSCEMLDKLGCEWSYITLLLQRESGLSYKSTMNYTMYVYALCMLDIAQYICVLCIYLCTCTYVCIYWYLFVFVCVRVRVCVRACTHVCVRMYVCVSAYLSVYTCVCMCVRTCVCMRVCIYICVCTCVCGLIDVIYMLRQTRPALKPAASIKAGRPVLKPDGPIINRWKLPTVFKPDYAQFTTQHAIESKHRYYIKVPIPSASSLAQLTSVYG